MKDPYKVLGVSPDASNDEIKKAYHNMAKKYHPDNYANTDLSSLAAEKMKEVNEAYDAIKVQRSGTGAGPSGGTYANNNTFSEELVRARQYFQTGRLTEANTLLEGMPQKDRNAEWNFLKGCVMIKRHWYYDAVRYLETACYMDPENKEYRDMLNRVQKAGDGYNNTGRTDSSVNGCSVCDICSSLLCANCLCNLCGGDMIHCC